MLATLLIINEQIQGLTNKERIITKTPHEYIRKTYEYIREEHDYVQVRRVTYEYIRATHDYIWRRYEFYVRVARTKTKT